MDYSSFLLSSRRDILLPFFVDSLFKCRVFCRLFSCFSKPNQTSRCRVNIQLLLLTDSLCQFGVLSFINTIFQTKSKQVFFLVVFSLFSRQKNVYLSRGFTYWQLIIVDACYTVASNPLNRRIYSLQPFSLMVLLYCRKTKPKDSRLFSFLALNVG